MARTRKKGSSQRSAISSQPKIVHSGTGVPPVAVHGGVGVSPAVVKNIHYPEKPERLLSPLGRNPPSPGLRRTSPLDGLVMEDSLSGTGVSPVSSGAVSPDATTGQASRLSYYPLQPLFRDDAHGILPRILFGAGSIRATPKAFGAGCLASLDAIAAKHPDGCFDMVLPLNDKRRLV